MPLTGGISRIATLLQQIKQETTTPVIVVSSGDDLMGKYFQHFKGKAIFKLMDLAGYDILALGNHEFDKGAAVLAQALGEVDITALCSDLLVTGTAMEDYCLPYSIHERQGLTVGFFSLMTKDFPVVTMGNNIRQNSDHIEVAQNMVHLLQQQGAQVIIALTHIGSKEDLQLAQDVTGIDIIFGGHSHDYQSDLQRVGNTLIVNGGEKGTALVRLDIPLDDHNNIIPSAATSTLIPITATIKPNAEMTALLHHYKTKLPERIVIGKTDREWDCSSSCLRNRESVVANMISDLIRSRFKTDAVLYNGGAFRGNTTLPPGPITNTMISELDAFTSTIYLLAIQGRYIKPILEHSASLIGQGGFLQVSGLRFNLDEKEVTQEISNRNGTYKITQTGHRISNIQIHQDNRWQPLKPEQYYRLASNDFLVHHGGDHYFWFRQYGQDIRNTYSSMGSILTNALQHHGTLNPKKQDGRIQMRPKESE